MKPGISQEVEGLKDLILWARSEGIVVHQLSVGEVHMTFDDTRVRVQSAPSKQEEDTRTTDEKWAEELNVPLHIGEDR